MLFIHLSFRVDVTKEPDYKEAFDINPLQAKVNIVYFIVTPTWSRNLEIIEKQNATANNLNHH